LAIQLRRAQVRHAEAMRSPFFFSILNLSGPVPAGAKPGSHPFMMMK
jgi:hypothetical protein